MQRVAPFFGLIVVAVIPVFAEQKTMALSGYTGHSLCEANVKKRKPVLSKAGFFRLASKHIVGRLVTSALTVLCRLSESRAELVRAMPSEGTAVIPPLLHTFLVSMQGMSVLGWGSSNLN